MTSTAVPAVTAVAAISPAPPPTQAATAHAETLSIEGGLFTAEWLQRVAAQQAPLQADADYAVRAGFNVREEIGLAWRSAQALWRQFDAARLTPGHDPWAVTQRFATELLRQAFGFHLTVHHEPLLAAERLHPIPFSAFGGRVPVIVSPHVEARPLDSAHDRLGDHSGERVRRRSAFGLLQESLNALPQALWGVATNGLLLRIARDNASLTRPAWVQVDLERLFAEERYADFSVLWLLLHASRFGSEAGAAADSPLEQWRAACRDNGVRARDLLRGGVEQALLTLGQGFVGHPANGALREALATGALSPQGLLRELLRLVYRQIFLLTVEERDILHPTGTQAEARALYAEGYGLKRLRERALRRSAHDRHGDLWQGLKLVWRGLAGGEARLGLPALGGLFDAAQCPHLDAARLDNRHLLQALFHLAWLRAEPQAPWTRVNWRDMGPEELGSIYESLLELVPLLSDGHRAFRFQTGAATRGNARKTTASHYTHDTLVQLLLDEALEPLITRALSAHPSGQGAVNALLALTVVDPSCGSGHFLLGAARRIAMHLARVMAEMSGNGQPTPADYRHALRQVIARCIYGVDRNPMALELCKVALWLEGVEPGRPLGFLDAHLRCGDALLGVHDLSVLRSGIPAEAFSPLKDVLAATGIPGLLVDDRDAAAALKRRNAGERAMPTLPLAGLNLGIPEGLDAVLAQLVTDDEGLSDVEVKRQLFEQSRAKGTMAGRLLRACDLWTAAFFSVKRPVERQGRECTPTSDVVWRYLADPQTLQPHVEEEVEALRREYRFFHWPLEFPEVFKRGGFSLVLGNPPWETMSPDAKEFFAKHEPEIAGMTPVDQQACIAELLTVDEIRSDWERHARDLYAAVRFVKESGRYRMFAAGNLGKGDFNVYRQFAELALSFAAPDGVAAQIVPENFYNGANAAAIRAALLNEFRVSALYGFENMRGVWFAAIDTRMKFALYCAWRSGSTTEFPAAFAINSEARLQAARVSPLRLPVALLREFSPEALAVMEFSNQLEIDIARKMYSRFPRLGDEIEGLPDWEPVREVDMGTDNDLFTIDARGWPLYQGSMVTHHDYRAKGYLAGHGRNVTWQPLAFGSPAKSIQPQWRVLPDQIPNKIRERVRRYRIGFCDVARADDQRSLMAALIPPGTVCGDKVPTIEFEPVNPAVTVLWLGVANSLSMDFVVRMKVSLKMSMSLMATLPFPRRVSAEDATARACSLAARLSCSGPEMADFLRTLQREPALAEQELTPSDDPEERASIAAELDVVVARDLFGLTRDEMRYLLDPRDVLGADCTAETFAALRRAEEREFGEYRTRRLVMEAWDRLEAGELR
ncbi:MAG: Eco57I restriction-modification methylase domain-containing protein [Rubrivivax sp.]